MDLIKILEENTRKFPDKPAIIFKDKPVTFLELRDWVFKLAYSLKELGIKRDSKVAIYLPSCPEYIVSYLAVWFLGATAVPLDFMLTEDELVSCLSHADVELLIVEPKANLQLSRLKEKCPDLKKIVIHGDIKKDSGGAQEYLLFQQLLSKGDIDITPREIKPGDYAIIFYTSGTTGKPKGVLINYSQLGAPPMAMQYFVDLNENDIVLCALPFSHLGGLIYIQNNIVYGVTMVLMERFTPLDFLKNIQFYRVTCFWIVPSMYYAFLQLKEFENFDLSSLRWMVTFGASNSPEALRRFHQYCPKAHLLNGWGLTETNAPTTVIPMGSDNIESVGMPAPWIEVKIFACGVDKEDKELPAGSVGEVVVKGWVVTDGYFKDTSTSGEALRDGWFHTGDLGKFDNQGYLYIVGRKKEMIKVGGEIVFEPEVEAAIQKHPGILEAAVIGVPHNLRGEVPKAYIVLKEGHTICEAELRFFCRQHLAHFKIPHYFEFKQALPKNRVGKIDKEALRAKSRE